MIVKIRESEDGKVWKFYHKEDYLKVKIELQERPSQNMSRYVVEEKFNDPEWGYGIVGTCHTLRQALHKACSFLRSCYPVELVEGTGPTLKGWKERMTDEIKQFRSVQDLADYLYDWRFKGDADEIFQDKREYDDFDYGGLVTERLDDIIGVQSYWTIMMWTHQIPDLLWIDEELIAEGAYPDDLHKTERHLADIIKINLYYAVEPLILERLQEDYDKENANVGN